MSLIIFIYLTLCLLLVKKNLQERKYTGVCKFTALVNKLTLAKLGFLTPSPKLSNVTNKENNKNCFALKIPLNFSINPTLTGGGG